jgi:hypothetical protein
LGLFALCGGRRVRQETIDRWCVTPVRRAWRIAHREHGICCRPRSEAPQHACCSATCVAEPPFTRPLPAARCVDLRMHHSNPGHMHAPRPIRHSANRPPSGLAGTNRCKATPLRYTLSMRIQWEAKPKTPEKYRVAPMQYVALLQYVSIQG